MNFKAKLLKNERISIVLLICLVQLTVTGQAIAVDDNKVAFPETFMLRLSSYSVDNVETDVSVNSTLGVGVGTNIDYSRDLGGDDSATVLRLDMYYRFNPRHRIDFSQYRVQRSGERTLEIEIDFEDERYEIGERLSSDIDYTMYRLGYSYSFYHSEQVELSFSAGLNIMEYDFEISNTDGSDASDASVTAPLPMFGLRIGYAITPKWSIHYLSETFFIEIEDTLKGSLLNSEFTLRYRLFDHFILGAGLADFSADLEAHDSDWDGRIEESSRGYSVFLSYYL